MTTKIPPPDLSLYINAIAQRFRPALTPSEATHRYSTSEIRAAIKDLNPAIEVTDTHVFDAMQQAGFIFDTAPGSQSLRFRWLMVEK